MCTINLFFGRIFNITILHNINFVGKRIISTTDTRINELGLQTRTFWRILVLLLLLLFIYYIIIILKKTTIK